VEHQAKREQRPIRDGEVTPACAQACPAGVYTFGDLKDERSEVHRLFRDHPRRYQVLRDLNTKPGIVYLKKVWNDG
jgi:Fe-S-cluster-containing dehydrogenase component